MHVDVPTLLAVLFQLEIPRWKQPLTTEDTSSCVLSWMVWAIKGQIVQPIHWKIVLHGPHQERWISSFDGTESVSSALPVTKYHSSKILCKFLQHHFSGVWQPFIPLRRYSPTTSPVTTGHDLPNVFAPSSGYSNLPVWGLIPQENLAQLCGKSVTHRWHMFTSFANVEVSQMEVSTVVRHALKNHQWYNSQS